MPMQTKLISVTIVYCKNGKQFQKEIDLKKAGGLWWDHAGAGNTGHNFVPGKTTPLNTDCTMDLTGGGSACWWDPQAGQWVCPDGLG